MKLNYQGRHERGVFVPVGDGEVFFAQGGTGEVPADVGRKLLVEQPDSFTETKTVSGKSSKTNKAEEAD